MILLQNKLNNPTFKVITGLASGSLFVTVSTVFLSLIQARFVSPEDLGFLRSFSIITGYLFFFNLGIFDAIYRLYPLLIGKGEKEKALSIAETAQTWSIIISLIPSVIFLILAIISIVYGNWRTAAGWIIQILTIVVMLYGGYLGATYRTGHDFLTITKGSIISNLLNLLTIPIFPFFPFLGLVLRSSMGNIYYLLHIHIKRPLKLKFRIEIKTLYGLIKQGIPIFIAGYGSTILWSVVQSTIVLKIFGTKTLGLWVISVMLLEAINKIPQSIISVYTPRVTELFGKTNKISECIKYIKKPVGFALLISILIVVFGWIILPLLIPIIMPKYIDALPTISIILLILPIMSFELPNSLLVAMDKRLFVNISVYVGLSFFVIFSFLFTNNNQGLIQIAYASLLAYVIRMIFVGGFLLKIYKEELSIIN